MHAILCAIAVLAGDEVAFTNGKAAGHPETGLICVTADENHIVTAPGFEVLTIWGTPQHTFRVATSDRFVWPFHGQTHVAAVEAVIGGDGYATVCFSTENLGPATITVRNVTTNAFAVTLHCYAFRLVPKAVSKSTTTTSGKGVHKNASIPEFADQFRVPGFAVESQAEESTETVGGSVELSLRVVPDLIHDAALVNLEPILKGVETRADRFRRSLIVRSAKHEAYFHQGQGTVKTGRRIEMTTPAILELKDAHSPEEADTIFGISGTKGSLALSRNSTRVTEKSFEVLTVPMIAGREPGIETPTDCVKVAILSEIDTTVTVHVESTATGEKTRCSTAIDVKELVVQLRPVVPEPFVKICPAQQ